MPTVDEVDRLIAQYHQALDEFVRGNPEPVKNLFSHRDDVIFANPLVGLPANGGSRSPRPWSMPHRSSERAARSLVLRT